MLLAFTQRTRRFRRWLGRLRLPIGVLVTLLQRTPILQVAERGSEFAATSPAGALLRSAVATATLLGAAQTLVGATPLAPSSGAASGITLALHASVLVAYTVNGTASPPLSWTVGGSIPPGLNFTGLTSPGVVNTQTEQNPNGLLILGGSPTAAGTYDVTLVAWGSPDGDGAKSDTFNYRIVITPGAGGAPAFTTQPQDQIPVAGQAVSFTAAASGTLAYQWQFNGVDISGATGATLTLTNVQPINAGVYSVTATNANGATESNNATLTIALSPTFSRQPRSQTIANGSTVAFAVAASGIPAPTYQWYFNNAALAGATSATLVIPAASAAQAGSYRCIATNSAGTLSSDPVNLTVASSTPPGRLVNLSVLSAIQGTLSMGFVLGGAASGSQPLLIRAIGPALGQPPFNVPAVMPDPTLTVVRRSDAVTLATNGGWGSPPGNRLQVTAADAALGAFALNNTGSLDSALVTTLPISAGGYTVQVTGKAGDSGYALAEVYDDTAAYTPALPRLVNLSCLTTVAAGGTLNVGFVIGGSTAKTVLIRVSGPALAAAPFNVPGTMPDPTLSLQPLNSATVLAENSRWGGDSQLATVAAAVGAFAFTNPLSRDAAVVVTLAPQVPYTVQVTSASGTAGIVLVEVYDVP